MNRKRVIRALTGAVVGLLLCVTVMFLMNFFTALEITVAVMLLCLLASLALRTYQRWFSKRLNRIIDEGVVHPNDSQLLSRLQALRKRAYGAGNRAMVRYNLASVLLSHARYDEALAELHAIPLSADSNASLLSACARLSFTLWEAKGEDEKAALAYEQWRGLPQSLRDNEASNPSSLIFRCRACLLTGDRAGAQTTFDTLSRLRPAETRSRRVELRFCEILLCLADDELNTARTLLQKLEPLCDDLYRKEEHARLKAKLEQSAA